MTGPNEAKDHLSIIDDISATPSPATPPLFAGRFGFVGYLRPQEAQGRSGARCRISQPTSHSCGCRPNRLQTLWVRTISVLALKIARVSSTCPAPLHGGDFSI